LVDFVIAAIQIADLAKTLLERHANSLWIPAHLTDDEAAEFVLDHFKRRLKAIWLW
jgi:hypothetical protein